jgi:hypothetical protein
VTAIVEDLNETLKLQVSERLWSDTGVVRLSDQDTPPVVCSVRDEVQRIELVWTWHWEELPGDEPRHTCTGCSSQDSGRRVPSSRLSCPRTNLVDRLPQGRPLCTPTLLEIGILVDPSDPQDTCGPGRVRHRDTAPEWSHPRAVPEAAPAIDRKPTNARCAPRWHSKALSDWNAVRRPWDTRQTTFLRRVRARRRLVRMGAFSHKLDSR